MKFSNPILWREWLRFRSRWPLWILLILGAAILEYSMQSGWYVRALPLTRQWGMLGQAIRLIIRSPFLIALYLVMESLEREKNNHSWEQIFSTPLTMRQIFWGKIIVPWGFLCLLDVLLIPITYYLLVSDAGIPRNDIISMFLVSMGSGLIEDFLYALMSCTVVFYLGWRRPMGETVGLSLGVMIGVGLLVSTLAIGLSILVFSTFSSSLLDQPMWVQGLVYSILFLIPTLGMETGITIWSYHRALEELREMTEITEMKGEG